MCTTFTARSFVVTSSTITTNDIETSAYCYAMLVAYCKRALALYNLEDAPTEICSVCGKPYSQCWCNIGGRVDGPTETCSVCGKPFSQCWCNVGSQLDSSPGSSDLCKTCNLPFAACACGRGTRKYDGPDETCSVCGKSYSQCWCNAGG